MIVSIDKLNRSNVLLLIALLLWLSNVLLHLEFSFFITTPFPTPFGEIVLRDYWPAVAIVISVLTVFYIIKNGKTGINRPSFFFALALWIVITCFASLWLLTTAIETIHFLQYALIANLLCRSLDPGKSTWPLLQICLLATFLGILDELNQYFYLAASYGFYVDFNDFFLNQIGVIAGILLYYGFSDSKELSTNSGPYSGGLYLLKITNLLTYSLVVLVTLLGVLLDVIKVSPNEEIPPGGVLLINGETLVYLQRLPNLFGSWQPSFTGALYFVLSPLQGIVALSGGFLGIYVFQRLAKPQKAST